MNQQNVSSLISLGVIPIIHHENEIYEHIEMIGGKMSRGLLGSTPCETLVISSKSANSFCIVVKETRYILITDGLLDALCISVNRLLKDKRFADMLSREFGFTFNEVSVINVVGHASKKVCDSPYAVLFYDIFEAAIEFILLHEVSHIYNDIMVKTNHEVQDLLDYSNFCDMLDRSDLCQNLETNAERWEEYIVDRDASCYYMQSFFRKIVGQYSNGVSLVQVKFHLTFSVAGQYLALVVTSRFLADQSEDEFLYNHLPYEARHYAVYSGALPVINEAVGVNALSLFSIMTMAKDVIEIIFDGRKIEHSCGGVFKL